MIPTKQQTGLSSFSLKDKLAGIHLSRGLKTIILIELLLPVSLLTLGIYHGLMQTIYRSGAIHETTVAHLDYYQGLTLHGVINAIVLTSFFAVAFGHATMAFYLKREPGKKIAWLSLALMVTGTLLAAWAMLTGNASAMKSRPGILSRRSLAHCRFMASPVRLGQTVYPMEKRKSGN